MFTAGAVSTKDNVVIARVKNKKNEVNVVINALKVNSSLMDEAL
jgi:hypothetical protein